MSARLYSFLLPALFVGCVAYERDDAQLSTISAEIATRSGGSYTFEQAAALTLRRHAELRAAEARARALGAAATVPFAATGEWRGRNEAIGVMIDPVALLGLGPRGAAIEAAEARVVEATIDLVVRRWRTLGELARVYRLHQVSQQLPHPSIDLDVDAFERSGLASPVAAAMLRAAQARALSESRAVDELQHDQIAEMRHLLALPTNAVVELRHEEWQPAVAGSDTELLGRPDLALAVARFEVADREFRKAVADQYPSLQIGPNVSLRGDPLRAMGMLNIPIAMHGLAAAARARREASRHEVEDALIEARRDAELAHHELLVAQARRDAARSALTAHGKAFEAARAALEVEPDAFQQFASAASAWIEALARHREAEIGYAAAEVGHAIAYGWPRVPETEEENR